MADLAGGPLCGVDGCADPVQRIAAGVTQSAAASALELSIVSDAICPWCYIGKRRLEKALVALGPAARVRTVWRPFELNPDMPKDGIERHVYRMHKFGSLERSKALDAQVTEAAEGEGLSFRYDLIQRTPNTFDAHRLLWLAGETGDKQDALMEAIFRAYFTEGRNIGDRAVLWELAPTGGIEPARARAFLDGETGAAEVNRDQGIAKRTGLSGVPAFVAQGRLLFSGAQPSDVMGAVLGQLVTVPVRRS
jgi:predicted DsbA family dithiol-disulfide isomerase